MAPREKKKLNINPQFFGVPTRYDPREPQNLEICGGKTVEEPDR
jgi:hypothetical protein